MWNCTAGTAVEQRFVFMDFSIIIPAYNAEALIGMCLDSLTAQDYPTGKYEIIVVDDCSPDGLADVVRDRQEGSPNIVLLRTERNVRQGGARNLGLDHARGRYVLFVDADDMWLRRDVLSTFARFLANSEDVSFVEASDYKGVGFDEVPELSASDAPELNARYVTSTERLLVSKNLCACWLSCYKKEFLLDSELRFAEGVCFEDLDWRMRCVAMADRIAVIDFLFYGYRNNPQSTTLVHNGKLLKDNLAASVRMFRWIDEHPGALKEADERIIKWRDYRDVAKFKFTRLFTLRDNRVAFKQIEGLRVSGVEAGLADRMLFQVMTHVPSLVYVPVRGGYLLKCWIRKNLCSR